MDGLRFWPFVSVAVVVFGVPVQALFLLAVGFDPSSCHFCSLVLTLRLPCLFTRATDVPRLVVGWDDILGSLFGRGAVGLIWTPLLVSHQPHGIMERASMALASSVLLSSHHPLNFMFLYFLLGFLFRDWLSLLNSYHENSSEISGEIFALELRTSCTLSMLFTS